MSLINDVLKNLEHRQVSQPSTNADHSSFNQTLYSDGLPEQLSYFRLTFFISASIVVVAALAFAGYYSYQYTQNKKMAMQHQMKKHLIQKMAGPPRPLQAKPLMMKNSVKMVELANPALRPTANAPLPPPPDLQGNSAGSEKKAPMAKGASEAVKPGLAGANEKTITVPLSSLKEATSAPANGNADPLNFTFSESHTPTDAMNVQLTRIDELALMGDLEQAKALFKKLPANADAQSKVILEAKLLIYENKDNQAIQLLEKFIEKNSPSADCLGLLGALYDATGRYQLSELTYQKLVNFWPDDTKWWLGLAIAAMHGGQYSLAITSFERVQASSNNLPPEVNDFVHIKLRMLTTDHPTYY